MRFGKVQTHLAKDSILAHSLRLSDGRIRKGTVLTAHHLEKLLANDIDEVTVATVEDGDIHEDEAAQQLAEAFVGCGIKLGRASTGRVNCYATTAGLLTIPRERLLAINAVSESITASTLPENRWVEAGKMVATVKIIPYSVTNEALQSALHACTSDLLPGGQSFTREPDQLKKLGVHQAKKRHAYLLQTTMQDMPLAILEKTENVTNRRLALRNVELANSTHCLHDVEKLTKQLQLLSETRSASDDLNSHNWILISGASAISDRRDVIPKAVEAAGGTVSRCGIPVDPGNLLMLGELAGSTVIGIPGCARSPKHNGLDLFMDRLACDLPVTEEWINSLAIGGLMDEIIDRPTPRSRTNTFDTTVDPLNTPTSANVTAILLAGGSSKRFGVDNKLFAERHGKPLISHALDNIVSSQVQRIIIVLGHDAPEVKSFCEKHLNEHAQSKSIDVEFTLNVDFDSGMGSSLKAGISTLLKRNIKETPSDSHAALVCLADMPSVSPKTIQALIRAMHESTDSDTDNPEHTSASAFVPTYKGTRGNPVLLMPELFDLLLDLAGDFGARHLLQANKEAVREVVVTDAGIFLDCDTPEQLRTLNTTDT